MAPCFLTSVAPRVRAGSASIVSPSKSECSCGSRMSAQKPLLPRTAVPRRSFLSTAGAAVVVSGLAPVQSSLAALPTVSAIDSATLLVDSSEYSYAIPSSGLKKNIASLNGGRVATIWVDESDGDSNISCVETPIQSDFQKLTSFGPVDNVLETVCPKSVAGNEVIQVDTRPAQNAYVIEYKIQPGGDLPLRHLVTVFSLQPGAELITLTCQSRADKWGSKEKMFKDVVQSYKLKLRD